MTNSSQKIIMRHPSETYITINLNCSKNNKTIKHIHITNGKRFIDMPIEDLWNILNVYSEPFPKENL